MSRLFDEWLEAEAQDQFGRTYIDCTLEEQCSLEGRDVSEMTPDEIEMCEDHIQHERDIRGSRGASVARPKLRLIRGGAA